MTMETFQYRIKDGLGIHARPAGILVKEVKKYGSIVKIKKGDREVYSTQLLGLMSLSVKCGDEITINIEGEDEKNTCLQLQQFFQTHL